MPITPGINQISSLLGSLVRQGTDPSQQIQGVSDPEGVVSPADVVLQQDRTPVLRQLSMEGYGGWEIQGAHTVSGIGIITISDPYPIPIGALRLNFHPIKAGTGAIIPITGYNSISITRCGKNLLNVYGDDFAWGYYRNDGTPSNNPGDRYEFCDLNYYYIKAGATITISANDTFTATVCVYDTNKQIKYRYDTGTNTQPWTLPIEQDDVYVRIGVCPKPNRYHASFEAFSRDEIQFELNANATDYEIYNGSDYIIQFGSTYYGGTLDAIAGKLYVDWLEIASYNGEDLPGVWMSDRDTYAPGTTPTIGAQVVYQIPTPIVVDVTPISVELYSGINNIWSDANGIITALYAAE